MTISIQRGRQFAVGDSPVFDENGKAGGYLAKVGDQLVSQGITVKVGTTTLATKADWKAFIAANAATDKKAATFGTKFGMTFQDFLNVVDDVAVAPDKGYTLDLSTKSPLRKQLSLDKKKDDYAAGLKKDDKITIAGTGATQVEAVAAGVATIGPDILKTPITSDWERDRSEQESWEDFKLGDGAGGKFKDHTGPQPFAKLFKPQWNDPEAMALANRFTLPLVLEVDSQPNAGREPNLVIPDPTAPNDRSKDQKIFFQDGYENFRDTYFDDVNGSLQKAGASVRNRVRFDNKPPNFAQKDVRVQAKEGRVITGTDSAVHKFEKRSLNNEDEAAQMLVTGQETPDQPLLVAQKLYKLAQDKKTLPADGQLTLQPKFTVLQKRRRTHFNLDSVDVLKTRAAGLQKEAADLKAAGKPVPATLTAYQKKVDGQIKFLTDADAMLTKYGQFMSTWGDCFIISADRYNVYDPTARKGKINDIDDEEGLLGKGPLHVEAEWDSASSDVFEKALDEAKKRIADAKAKLAATPAPNATDKAALEKTLAETQADLKTMTAMRDTFLKDVAMTVEVIKEGLVGAGLKLDNQKLSKDDRANAIAAKPRPVFWP